MMTGKINILNSKLSWMETEKAFKLPPIKKVIISSSSAKIRTVLFNLSSSKFFGVKKG